MKFSLLIFVLLVGASSSLFAQARVDAHVAGWIEDALVLEVEREGVLEKEDGTTEDYFKETIEVYDKSTGVALAKRLNTRIAKDKKKLKFSDSGQAQKGVLSPHKGLLVNVLSRKRIERKTNQTRCVLTHELRLFDQNTARIYDMFSLSTASDYEKGRFPTCPKVKGSVFWRADNAAFSLVFSERDSLKVYNFSLKDIQSKKKAVRFEPFLNPALTSKWLDKQPLWKSIFLHRKVAKLPKYDKKNSRENLAKAFLEIKAGQTAKGLKKAKKAMKKLKKNSLNATLISLVFGEAKKLGKASKSLDKVVRKGSLPELIEAANIFQLFDLNIAAELYVAALSRKRLNEKDSILVYTLLLRTLLDSGNMDAATEVVAKLGALKADELLQVLRYRVLRREPSILPAIDGFVAEHGAICEGYLLLGRALGYKNSRDAMIQYRTAMQCDPNLGEAIYLLADMEKRAGHRAEAKLLFDRYRVVSPPRRGDSIRDSRRQYAYDLTHPKTKVDTVEK